MIILATVYRYTQAQWPLVDPFTGTAPSHNFLTSLGHPTVNALSLWDMTIPLRYIINHLTMYYELLLFSVCIGKISNIPLAEKDTIVEIQVGLYNGGKKLKGMTTAAISLKQGNAWNEKLIFDLTIQKVPKVAASYVLYQITACNVTL